MVNNKMASEDIVQNIFLKLYENINSIQNRNSINFWLFSTAKNEVYAHYRKKKTHIDSFKVDDSSELEIESGLSIENNFELRETKELIMNELNEMAPEQKEIFILKEYSGLSYGEIASIMKIDEALVKSRLYKTRQKLIGKISKLVK